MGVVSRIVKKEIWAFEMKHFTILLILTVLLSGCARKDPVETIIDNHVSHIDEVLTYAKNNIEQTADIMMLEGELKSCQMALVDTKETYASQKDGYESKIRYWRLMAASLFVGLLVALFGLIRRVFI